MTIAQERLRDPLVDAVLGLCQAYANAEIADRVERAGYTETDNAIVSTLNYPITAQTLGGELSLPVLSCYAVRQRSMRRTFGHRDEEVRLRFNYVAAAVAQDRIDERWPILGLVWRAVWGAIVEGHHEDYLDDAQALDDVGVVWVPESATVSYGFLPGGDYAFPQFTADVDFGWRPRDGATTVLYPMLGVDYVIEHAGEALTAVSGKANTPTGDEADLGAFEDEEELP